MSRRIMLAPDVLAQLLEPLTEEETNQCWRYAMEDGPDEFAFRATEWLMRRYDLTTGPIPEDLSDDATVVVQRVFFSNGTVQ